ncbi:hypothetical protein NpNSSI1_00011449 [Neofusicoccum parvum]|nr:hypothetical protein NpNSSI1_00011449 [Neofusicoccum parvum]
MDDPIGAFIDKCHSTEPKWKHDELRDQLEQIELVSLKACIGILEKESADTHTALLERMLEQQQEQQEKPRRAKRAPKQEHLRSSDSSAPAERARRESVHQHRRLSTGWLMVALAVAVFLALAAVFAVEWWKGPPSEHPMDESVYDLATLFNKTRDAELRKTRDAMVAAMGESETRYPNQIPLDKLFKSARMAQDKRSDMEAAFSRLWPPGILTQNSTVENAREMLTGMRWDLITVQDYALVLEREVGGTLVTGSARINASLDLQSRTLRWAEREANISGWQACWRSWRVASMRWKVWQDACKCQKQLVRLVESLQARVKKTQLAMGLPLQHIHTVVNLMLSEIEVRNGTVHADMGRLRDSHREALVDWASWAKNRMRNSTCPIISLAAGLFGDRRAPEPPHSHLSEPREDCRRLAISTGHVLSMQSQLNTLDRELESIKQNLLDYGRASADKDTPALFQSDSHNDPISYVADLNDIWIALIDAIITWGQDAFVDDTVFDAASE